MWKGEWATSICHGTDLAKNHGHNLPSLRAWKRGIKELPAIYGAVSDLTRNPDGGPKEGSFSVRLRGAGFDLEATTDDVGKFAFRDLIPGSYTLSASRPGWKSAFRKNSSETTVDLAKRPCALEYLSMRQTLGKVHGRMAAAPGKVTISASSEKTNATVSLKPNGEFEFDDLWPGDYVLSVGTDGLPTSPKSPLPDALSPNPFPATYYPGVRQKSSARTIRVENGTVVDLPEWVLPARLGDRRFLGTVSWPDGTPAENVRIFLFSGIRKLQRSQPSASTGTFEVWGIEGIEYRAVAVAFRPSDGLYFVAELPAYGPLNFTLAAAGKEPPNELGPYELKP